MRPRFTETTGDPYAFGGAKSGAAAASEASDLAQIEFLDSIALTQSRAGIAAGPTLLRGNRAYVAVTENPIEVADPVLVVVDTRGPANLSEIARVPGLPDLQAAAGSHGFGVLGNRLMSINLAGADAPRLSASALLCGEGRSLDVGRRQGRESIPARLVGLLPLRQLRQPLRPHPKIRAPPCCALRGETSQEIAQLRLAASRASIARPLPGQHGFPTKGR